MDNNKEKALTPDEIKLKEPAINDCFGEDEISDYKLWGQTETPEEKDEFMREQTDNFKRMTGIPVENRESLCTQTRLPML